MYVISATVNGEIMLLKISKNNENHNDIVQFKKCIVSPSEDFNLNFSDRVPGIPTVAAICSIKFTKYSLKSVGISAT
jgi:hypothetical protein